MQKTRTLGITRSGIWSHLIPPPSQTSHRNCFKCLSQSASTYGNGPHGHPHLVGVSRGWFCDCQVLPWGVHLVGWVLDRSLDPERRPLCRSVVPLPTWINCLGRHSHELKYTFSSSLFTLFSKPLSSQGILVVRDYCNTNRSQALKPQAHLEQSDVIDDWFRLW